MRRNPLQVTSFVALLPASSAALLMGCGGEEADPMAAPEESGPAGKAEAATAVNDGKADWSLDWCARRGWYGDHPKHDSANEDTGFDHLRFDRNVAFDLADQGF